MSGAREKALALLGSGSAKRDVMLLSLIRQVSLTDGQKRLIEKMWQERRQHKEAEMKKKIAFAVVAAVAMVGLSGCAATYEKRFMDHDGKVVVIQETHAPDWWNNLGTPEWMNVRHERILRDGTIMVDRTCRHDAGSPTMLDCTK